MKSGHGSNIPYHIDRGLRAASIGGLYVGLQTKYSGYFLLIFFGVTLLLCGYILFVPGSALERNVASKIWPSVAVYTDATKPGQQVEVQKRRVSSSGIGSVDIQFNRPFAAG